MISKKFSANIFLFIFFSVLIVSILLFGTLLFVSRNTTLQPSEIILVPSSEVPNAPEPISTQFSSNEPLEETSLPAIWESLSPLPTQNRGLITNGNRIEQRIALTFDVCQSEGELAGYDTGIIQILVETQTPATFFLGGLWMHDHQAETLELASNPLFELGNHSWSHLDFSVISPEEINKEIQLTQQQMYDLLGYQTNLFRLPYGTYNDITLNVIGENGLYTIQWDVVSGDPDPNIDATSMSEWVLQQVNPGSIIIMHANERGWHTAEALPTIIQSLRQDGYTLVTISDLLNIEYPK